MSISIMSLKNKCLDRISNFFFLTHFFLALGQVKQTTFMSHLDFILPSAPGHITVKQARKKSKHTGLFHISISKNK